MEAIVIKSISKSVVSVKTNGKYWNGVIEFSADGLNWQEWKGTKIVSTIIYMRGTGNTILTSRGCNENWKFEGENLVVKGNLETLLDYKEVEKGNHPIMGDWCFYGMFYGCTDLISAPDLLADSVSEFACSGMFAGCTDLMDAPKLAATNLSDWCYIDMFYGCTSLITAPSLPATELACGCYSNMFYHCTYLLDAPELPATKLMPECYSNMFDGCMCLRVAPKLPNVKLKGCCNHMFRGCNM